MNTEDEVWNTIDPEYIWIYDKLILSKKLGYNCGPVGLEVPIPGWYIVRPIVNLIGLGYGANKVWIDKSTDELPIGCFWCEWFEGEHLSIDYYEQNPVLSVQGFKEVNELMYWDAWMRVEKSISFPSVLRDIPYTYVNCEFIGNNLIECQLRKNLDFQWGNNSFIPVWENENTNPPEGWRYVEYPDLHGRIGAFIQ